MRSSRRAWFGFDHDRRCPLKGRGGQVVGCVMRTGLRLADRSGRPWKPQRNDVRAMSTNADRSYSVGIGRTNRQYGELEVLDMIEFVWSSSSQRLGLVQNLPVNTG